MPANVVEYTTALIYGDMGAAELGFAAPPVPVGSLNHLRWTLATKPSSSTTTVTGAAFLTHHLDYMLVRYQAWRSKYVLPPLRPWNGQDVFPNHHGNPPVGPTMPATLSGAPFPSTWTLNDLGTAIRTYYNDLRHFSSSFDFTEMNQDEIKAPFSYRYWAFMKWAEDLRKRFQGIPVIPVEIMYDHDGTILTDKDFTDVFHQVHHVWHPDGVGSPWVTATPYFRTSVGQHARKKEISRTQVGAEFFAFHRDHMDVYDRWLARTGHVAMPSLNVCAHDAGGASSPPAGVEADFSGNPKVDWSSSSTNPTVVLNPVHATYWNGDLREFRNLGLMGNRFATDNNPFTPISVPGTSDSGYHGTGHILNGDLIEPVANNHVPRFFAWHGHIDDLWAKRRPDFTALDIVRADSSPHAAPQMLTIVRDLLTNTDVVEPSNAVQAIDLNTGQGTLRLKLNVRVDPFGRPLRLELRCDILREAASAAPVITLSRTLTLTPLAPTAPSERRQGIDFVEVFAFDGSAGTTDADGDGPFKSDNPGFAPTSVGFKNSAIRMTAYLTCNQEPTGAIPPATGSIGTSGTTLTGTGTSFNSQLVQGDLVRAAGHVRAIAAVASNTSATLLDAFPSDVPAGTSFERLDGFDHERVLELPLLQEKQAPAISPYLDRSSFSKDQVQAIAVGGSSTFPDAFYIILQDRSTRPATISWPSEVDARLQNLLAPPVYSAGLHLDQPHHPQVQLQDLAGNPVPGVTVSVSAGTSESPSLHPGLPQRILHRCTVTFTGTAAFGAMASGAYQDVKLVITATDRAGNQVTDDTKRVRLLVDANPYILDGPTSWLSTDTRAFKIRQGEARFGIAAGWTDPYSFIQQALANLRSGTAPANAFDGLPTDQEGALLEYSPSVNGTVWYNFALAKVRLQSQTGAADVRASFRLFRWGVANVEFDDALAYRSAGSGVAMLGRTSTNELASIPFYAQPRRGVNEDMAQLQADDANKVTFPATAGEGTSYFGAFLDINETTVRFPAAFAGDGPFSNAQSIRTLLLGNHQCMVVEIKYPLDPTVPGATPGTSDNLAQRNLLIVQTANPGDPSTRTIQHPFDIDLTRKRTVPRHHEARHATTNRTHGHADGHGDAPLAGTAHAHLNPDENCCQPVAVLRPKPRTAKNGHHRVEGGWLAQSPEALRARQAAVNAVEANKAQWELDGESWKPVTGVDELAIFWNNLPKDSVVDLYLPGLSVADVFNFRSLRHAPRTVHTVDNHTLRLRPEGVTYIPIPPFWGGNLSGTLTVQLPAGIRKGQRFKVDVIQLRSDESRVLGGFQLNVQVEKAHDLVESDRRRLALAHRRFALTAPTNRWHSILEKEVTFLRQRTKAMAELAQEEGHEAPAWQDPTIQRGRPVRVVLERIRITNDSEPWFKGKGEFRFRAILSSRDNGGQETSTEFPKSRHFKLGDKPGSNEVTLDAVVFEGYVEQNLRIHIRGEELDLLDPDDRLDSYKRLFSGDPAAWIGSYGPDEHGIEELDGWQVWYRIENAG